MILEFPANWVAMFPQSAAKTSLVGPPCPMIFEEPALVRLWLTQAENLTYLAVKAGVVVDINDAESAGAKACLGSG